ncbi:MAG: hypothetical protein WC467_01025 [Patescibacteria group bacterium]
MNQDFRVAFVLLKEELYNAIVKDREDIALWRQYIEDIPFCELIEVSGEEILIGSLIKGHINLWRSYGSLDDYYGDDEYEDNDPNDPNRETRQKLTAKFYFKEKNKAILFYPDHECLPNFKGTWAEILLEIIDFIRRKTCEDPSIVKNLGEQIRLFQYSQEN